MKTPFVGGCACGAVRYECSAEPMMAMHCQCRDCQKDTGTGHSSHLAVPAAALKVSGAVKTYESTADSGNTVVRGFCSNCGSPILLKSSRFADAVFLTAGSLDEPSQFRPTLVIYTASAQPWDHVDPALPSVPSMSKT